MKFSDIKQPKEQPKKAALGRGLKGMFQNIGTDSQANTLAARGMGHDASHIYQLPITKVQPQVDQPRRYFNEEALNTLADSIKQDGILEPIVVRQVGDHYEIIAGERRWRAATKAGLANIPAIIKDISDDDTFALALVENIQRQDLTPMEEARAYHRLITQYKLTQEQVAARVGFERSTVANTIRLLQLPEDLQPLVDEGQLTAGHARALLSMSGAKAQRQLAKRIVDEHLTVRQAERIARTKNSQPAHPVQQSSAAAASAAAGQDLIDRLQKITGCKITLNDKNGKGSLELHFNSYAELDQITEHIK